MKKKNKILIGSSLILGIFIFNLFAMSSIADIEKTNISLKQLVTLSTAEAESETYNCTSGGIGSSSCSTSASGGGGGINGGTSCSVTCISGYYACCNNYYNKCQCRKS